VRPSAPRIEPVDPDSVEGETRALLDTLALGDAVNIFRTLANHPKLFKRWLVFGNHVLFKSTLPPRDRELVILRTGWRCRSEYEWGQHVIIGRAVGITEDEIERITRGADDPAWDAFEATLLRAADELHDDNVVGEETWTTLSERYSVEQLMDLVFAIGQYTLVSMALNSFGVQLDPGVEGFPA
jgi:4-carboxymuconolactone decarboxylase